MTSKAKEHHRRALTRSAGPLQGENRWSGSTRCAYELPIGQIEIDPVAQLEPCRQRCESVREHGKSLDIEEETQ